MGFLEYARWIWRAGIGALRSGGSVLWTHGIRRILLGASSNPAAVDGKNVDRGNILGNLLIFFWEHGIRRLFGAQQDRAEIDGEVIVQEQPQPPNEASSSPPRRNPVQPNRQQRHDENEQAQQPNVASSSTPKRNPGQPNSRPSNVEDVPTGKHPPNIIISGGDFYQPAIGARDVIYHNNFTKKKGKDSK
ncbi:uncharacterized protein LOC120333305 [Styela clava]